MGHPSVSGVIRELIAKSGKTTKAVALESGVNQNTLYGIVSKDKETDLVDLKTLQALANYFGYDITVFLGLDSYQPRVRLTGQEKALLADFRSLRPDVAAEVAEAVRRPPVPLSGEEKQLLSLYQRMNEQGRGKILDFCLDLESSGRYVK